MDTTSGGAGEALRAGYERQMQALREAFETHGDGLRAVLERSTLVDALITSTLKDQLVRASPALKDLCLIAVGGYGRQQLFPCSDVDLLFCTPKTATPEQVLSIRRISQTLWDCGLRVASFTRTISECEKFKPADPEWNLALLDMRHVAGDSEIFAALRSKVLERRSTRDTRALITATAALSRERHARFGATLFHLEPNVKDAPGGLRDAHVCLWLRSLNRGAAAEMPSDSYTEAFAFLSSIRVFLHLRHGRDDNTLDWHAQDEAARLGIGLKQGSHSPARSSDPAYWMRTYFRHARAIQRELAREVERSDQRPKPSRDILRVKAPARSGFVVDDGLLRLKQAHSELDPAKEPDIVLSAFGLIAETNVEFAPEDEERVAAALPALSTHLEDGPQLWLRLRRILVGRYAGKALRTMHALGLLELILPEFHGIDALVIRDAYHRYTVDEHTFVLIDALHSLGSEPPAGSPEWRFRFRSLLRDLAHPELLFLAALLHDTGKARAATDHAQASAALAEEVCKRLELEPSDRGVVVRLISCHLDMSAALRRDIFDRETVRVFSEKVGTHDLLRMLTLFTYADISAVHPDALTPWKAENLWRLSMSAANQLDRSVDDDRVHVDPLAPSREAEVLARSLGLREAQRAALERFLDGIPERYLRTRSPEIIHQHMQLSMGKGSHVLLRAPAEVNELTVITTNRPRLFADLTATLAGWGMNVVSAEAFSNAHGTVVDTFRFTDTYKTLELNPEERDRFLELLDDVVTGAVSAESQLQRRRVARPTKPRRVIETRIEFDNSASRQSTLLQVVAQDQPGLLRSASLALSDFGCSVEVALIDTEGEMAIDVFYLTLNGNKLDEAQQRTLRARLEHSIQGIGASLSTSPAPTGNS